MMTHPQWFDPARTGDPSALQASRCRGCGMTDDGLVVTRQATPLVQLTRFCRYQVLHSVNIRSSSWPQPPLTTGAHP